MTRNPASLGPRARQFAETWGPRVRQLSLALDFMCIGVAIAWLAGVLPIWVLFVVGVLRFVPPAVYGGIAGRKISEDFRAGWRPDQDEG